MPYRILEHPDIEAACRTGYPRWMADDEDIDDAYNVYDEDAQYEERRLNTDNWE